MNWGLRLLSLVHTTEKSVSAQLVMIVVQIWPFTFDW